MKIKLVSDFRDFYDHWMDFDGEIFRRVTTDGLDRLEMLQYLQKLEFKTPIYGKLKDISHKLKDFVVLHHDIHAHRGEGKELVRLETALEEFPNVLATQYIPFKTEEENLGVKGLSWRYLQVGVNSFWIEYKSMTDWRSNFNGSFSVLFGDKTELVSKRNYDLMLFKCPLFAIDFVPSDGELYAVDFNIAPGCEPIKDILSPKEAADSIKKAYKQIKDKYDG